MAAGGSHFERALGALLALDIGKVERHALEFADLRLRPREHLAAFEMVGELDERTRRHDLDFRARPGRLRSALRWTYQALAACVGADGGRQHAGNRGNGPV